MTSSQALKARSVSTFETLFRNSKLASLPKPIPDSRFSIKRINARNSLQKNLPTHVTQQIIMTTPANHSRNDWGLKYSIPSSNNSYYMVSNRLDTMDHMPDFDLKSAGKRHIIHRIQELGVPITPKKRIPRDSSRYKVASSSSSLSFSSSAASSSISQAFFGNPTETISFTDKFKHKNYQLLSKKHRERLLVITDAHREKFKLWMLQECGENYLALPFNELKQLAKTYLNTHVLIRNAAPDVAVMGAGGLNYNLPGTLRQTRFGISNQVVARGRVINDDNTAVALGGVVSRCQLSNEDKIRGAATASNARMTVKPFIVNGISIGNGGSIDMSVESLDWKSSRNKTLSTYKSGTRAKHSANREASGEGNEIAYRLLFDALGRGMK